MKRLNFVLHYGQVVYVIALIWQKISPNRLLIRTDKDTARFTGDSKYRSERNHLDVVNPVVKVKNW